MGVPQTRPRADMERSKVVQWVLLAGLAVILLRLFYIQVLRHDYFMNDIAPLLDSRGGADIVPYPGSILSYNGEALAESILLNAVVADPLRMRANGESFEGAAEQLAPLLGRKAADLAQELENHRKTNYAELARYVKSDTAAAVRKLSITGIALVPQWKREYPQKELACHLLGARDRYHRALLGLEQQYRLLLDGQPGATAAGNDPLGLSRAGSDQQVGPVAGKDLVVTIDSELQRQVETELERMWRREDPKWASCVVIDPRSGRILALAARPGYDPALFVTGRPAPGCRWSPVPRKAMENVPVTQTVEPGSTFKLLLVAAALDKGVITPSSTFYCPGHISVGGQPIRCWGKYETQGHGMLDVAGVLAQSCNVGAAQIALRLGAPAYYAFLRNAGVGVDPEAGFAAEAWGLIAKPARIRPCDLGNMGFGQNVSCSGLQLTSMVAGIANGGIMVHPHVLDRVLNKDGSLFRQVQVSEKRLCSAETSRLIRQMMQYTVEHGTASTAAMPDYKVGAKTGTAQQWDAAHGRHYQDRFMVSFIEVAPIDNPRYAIYVACNEPQVGRHGSDVCGPVSKRIAEYCLRTLDRPSATPAP